MSGTRRLPATRLAGDWPWRVLWVALVMGGVLLVVWDASVAGWSVVAA